MYCVISKPEFQLPTVISQNSHLYPEFIQAGYESVFTGTKRECQDKETEILEELCVND